MQSFKVSLILTLLMAAAAGAEEGAKPEAKSESEGESSKVIAPLPKEEKEFYDKTSRLNSLATRISEAEKQFQELVRWKATEKDPAEKQRIIKQMVEVTKERNKSAEEFMKVKSEIELRYPNKGAHLNRRYQTQTKKSLEEMEGAAGLDELLTRTKKIVEKKFATFNDSGEKQSETPKPVETDSEKPKRLRLEK